MYHVNIANSNSGFTFKKNISINLKSLILRVMTYPFYPFVPIYTEHFKVDSMALEQRIYVSYFKLSQLFMKSVYMYLNLIKYKVLFGIHVPVFIV